MGKSKTEVHRFFCMNCGREGIPLSRRISGQKERFHRKKLYCIYCRQEVNHVECKTEQDVMDFKINFENGVYENESYVRSTRFGQEHLAV